MKRCALLLLALLAPVLAPHAQAQMLWVEGEHFERINPAVPASTPGKVEVTEVFSYGCPACFKFQVAMDKIKAALPANAQLVLVPASWNT
jgi:thiol:disulfide interchange protein DsbA